jgi:hypothetical protein
VNGAFTLDLIFDGIKNHTLNRHALTEVVMPNDDERIDEHRDDRNYDDHRDEGDDRPRRPREKKSSQWTVLWVVGGVGCLMLLVCGGMIGFGIWWGYDKIGPLTKATITATEFVTFLSQNNIDGAYALTSKDYQRLNTPEQFAEFVKKHEILVKNTSRNVQINDPENAMKGKKKEFTFNVTLSDAKGGKLITLVVVEEQNAWKVDKVIMP